jgi:hypothetical protein
MKIRITISSHVLTLVIGAILGFAVAKYWIVSPRAVAMAVANWSSSFGISETNVPTEHLLSLVWQAVENPRRKTWYTPTSDSRTQPAEALPLLEANENNSISQFYRLTKTNEMSQHNPGP